MPLTPGRLDDGVQRLAIAVLRQAIEDAQGDGPQAAQARAWLHGRSLALQHWCLAAGIGTPAALHRYLSRPAEAVRPEWPPRRFDEDDEAA